jgi:hypothetical protein
VILFDEYKHVSDDWNLAGTVGRIRFTSPTCRQNKIQRSQQQKDSISAKVWAAVAHQPFLETMFRAGVVQVHQLWASYCLHLQRIPYVRAAITAVLEFCFVLEMGV